VTLTVLKYRYDPQELSIEEIENDADVEFKIRILEDKPHVEGMRQIHRYFEENEVYTDVLFYVYPNHEYTVRVRKDYYTDFIAELFKRKLLKSVEWAE
jgi:hypothetical protein